MQHRADTDPLYQRICAFEIDDQPVAYGFVARLARESGWSRRFAVRVVEEYKKFLYLCATADVPRTPSDQVDQAWHLHLTYTRSYWGRLCKDVLPRPVHHQPTRGGAAERDKFHDLYERTQCAYRAAFGSEPPVDIWPPAAIRFGADTRARRVNTARSWVIPKPWTRGAWWPWLRWAGMGLVLALAAALVGCANSESMRAKWNTLIAICLLFALLVHALIRLGEEPGKRSRRCRCRGGDQEPFTNLFIEWSGDCDPCDCGDGCDGDGGGGDGCGGCGGCGCG